MGTALQDLVLKVSSITGIGLDDINADSPVAKNTPGSIAIVVDAFGTRVLQYCKFVDAAGLGHLASRPANVSVANITAGSTLSATTTGLTADEHNGKLAYVLDDAGGAGAAPEGETTVIGKNTATLISFDKDRPLSAALAVNDDLTLVSTWQAEDSADGDLAVDVLGVVLGNQGVSDNSYGWVQREGFTQAALKAATALVAGDPVVADAACIGLFGTDGQELWVGRALAAATADAVSDVCLVELKLASAAGPGGSP